MLKKIVKKLIIRIFEIGYMNQENLLEKQRIANINKQAVIGLRTVIHKEAILQNGLNSPEKMQIGNESQILGHLMLFGHGGEITIGNHTFIGLGTRIWSAKKISIGNRVLISHDVNIHDNNSHPLDSIERHKDFLHIFSKGFQQSNDLREKEIIIGDDVWIGFNVSIMKGVNIGNGAIIGSNSVITKDVPEFAVIVGNPQRIIKYTT